MRAKPIGQKIQTAMWQTWMGQWAELIQSGMPVLDALLLSCELLGSARQSERMRYGLKRTARFLQEGQNLETAFRASFGMLPMPLEVSMLCAQASGDLGCALLEQLNRWKATSDAQQALGKSLLYPLVVMVLAVACWVFLHQVSHPHHAAHSPTQPSFTWSNSLIGLGFALLLLALFFRARRNRNQTTRRHLLPHTAWLSSSFYHVIACELHAGLDLMHCLRCRTVSNHKWFGVFEPARKTMADLNDLMLRIQQNLRQGMSLSQSMSKAAAPDFLVRQSHLAEQTGNLAYCFFLAAKVYEMKARETQQRLQSVLPPLALALAALTLAMAYQLTLAPLYNNLTGLT